MSAFLSRFRANYLEKVRSYPNLSLRIPIALARSAIFAWSQPGAKNLCIKYSLQVPSLIYLHWLPVEFRIKFKVLLFVSPNLTYLLRDLLCIRPHYSSNAESCPQPELSLLPRTSSPPLPSLSPQNGARLFWGSRLPFCPQVSR